ncbi:hypothetical protein [Ruegeria atlantica]|uniref:hypothetical protein n=1 Tax=Ruegeria atlantica TaxID=81569 RepID=UPI0014800A8C|nr:hypothetical protein [Ruegeria atlantica]
MRRMKLKGFVLRTALISAMIVGYLYIDEVKYMLLPKIKTVGEAESIISKGLKDGTPFASAENIEVSVENCQIHRVVEYGSNNDDSDVSLYIETYVDLRAYKLKALWLKPVQDLAGWGILHRIAARRSFKDIVERQNRRADEILEQTRDEIGGGIKTAVLTSERFLSEYPLKSLPAWSRRTERTGQNWVHTDINAFSLVSSDIWKLRAAVRKLNTHC